MSSTETAANAVADISAQEFWTRPIAEREAAFRRLRDEDPVSRQRQPEGHLVDIGGELTGPYWALSRYEDIRRVSRDPATFCSGRGVMLEDAPQEFLDAALSILAMDDPRHAAVRGLIGAGFTPRTVKLLEDGIRRDARQVVDELGEHGDGDFVALVAKRLPEMTIMRMLGVPEADRDELVHHADAMVSWNDPVYLDGRDPIAVVGEALFRLHQACSELAEERRASPGDDLLSQLVHAEIDGERLRTEEIAAFFVLLSVAGNDTTRHTSSHAMVAIDRDPEQRALLLEDPDARLQATAVDEFVRWASPVMTFRRTATRDCEIAGQPIAAGDKVVLLYPSGNRDERAFDRPDRFDVARTPNRHLGFGGGGPHYCLGAPLAKLQLRALFGELLTRYPRIAVGDPDPLVGNFVNGVRSLPMTLG
ncbi:cytochrome P450 [Patulibacter defluvii]|uniref:cytochrome P450 n=1 Tax=Patulibacter defluvii TaxID=3095358 RepID=UPI002A748700|nr:cytochrome P450 [Patulibacter sp. DM4]